MKVSLLLLPFLLLLTQQKSPDDYLITNLPGLVHPPEFKQYSGFIESTPGNFIFFWFVESQSNPAIDPLIYWTNGGPGSSGISYGFFTEHGPFRVSPDNKTLQYYDYSWNKIANVLYVEQPAGVGFSYSENISHYNTSDTQSSNDIFHFFINFFDIFTQFRGNDFYITSESYGGRYIPYTAKRIIDGKKEKGGDALFNRTKGFLIGNPATVNGVGLFYGDKVQIYAEYFFNGLLPVHAWNQVTIACDFGEYYTNCKKDFTVPTDECKAACKKADTYIPDPYDFLDVLAPVCQNNNETYGLTWNKAYDPCLDNYAPVWMQQKDVLEALHVEKHPNPNWPGDRDGFDFTWQDEVFQYYEIFLKEVPHWNIEIVTGTSDPDCPFTGTMRWVHCLDREIKKDAYDWKINGIPVGKTIEMEGITLTTVKGCGHTIPTYCPGPGFEFIKNFLGRTKK